MSAFFSQSVTTLTRYPLPCRPATEMNVSLKPQKKPQQPGSWTSEVHAARGFRPGSCRGQGETPAGLLAQGPGSRGGGSGGASGARGHFPRPGASQARARRAARSSARRTPYSPAGGAPRPPHSPPTGGYAHCTLARRTPPGSARRRRRRAECRGPRRRPHSAGPSDQQPRSGGPAAVADAGGLAGAG